MMGFPVTWLTPAHVILLLARIAELAASVPPPDVLMNVKRLMSKLAYQDLPLSVPLLGAPRGDVEREDGVGQVLLHRVHELTHDLSTSAGVHGWLCADWCTDKVGFIVKMMGRVVP